MSGHAVRQVGLPDRALLRQAVEQFAGPADSRAVETSAIDSWVTGFVASQQSFAFLAMGANDELIGWVWGSVHRRPDGPPVARVETLEVERAHRRSGVGSLLFDAVFAHARRWQCCELVADIGEGCGAAGDGFVESLRPGISAGKRVRWST